jgi:uncharacterized membrane protein
MLDAAAAAFLAIHLLIAGTRLRDAITATIGEGTYLALFSVASVAAIAWLCFAYNQTQAGGEDRRLYDLGRGVHDLGIPVVLLAFLIGVPGLLMPSPTSVKQEGFVDKEVRGVLRITRHPFLWGVALWSAFHLAANGDLASVVLFGTFFVLALFGTASIDAKRRRKLGAAWDDFAHRTSNLPFAAIAGGYFDWRFLVAAALFVAVLFGHPYAFGASPLPV